MLGIEEGDRMKPVGVMEFMNPDAKKQFYNRYRDLITEESEKFTFIEFKIKCRVKYRHYSGFLLLS